MDESRQDLRLGRLLGSGKEIEVYEYGGRVVKLYKPHAPKRSAFREAAILAFVESLDLPARPAEGVPDEVEGLMAMRLIVRSSGS